MKRNGYIVVVVAALAWLVAAIASGSLSLGLAAHGSTAHAFTAPACLPSTLDHDASLAGVGVDVSPEPGTDTANPHTQISFLGTRVANIHSVSAVGSKSGPHSGRLYAYSQGDGASFVPAKPFDAGERVQVRAVIATGKGARAVSFDFRIDNPYPTAGVSSFPTPRRRPRTTRASTRCPAPRPRS